MRSATIKRGKNAGGRPNVGARRKVAPKKKGLLAKAVEHLPISEEALETYLKRGTIGLGAALVIGVATFAGLPQMAYVEAAELVGRAGFEVKRVEVTGIDRMDRLTVYAVALDQESMAMPLVDLEKVRGDLLGYGWIRDARVSRRLPDTLMVDIIERQPAAIWQNARQLSLIDRDGVVLEPVKLDAMPDLPLVIGPEANRQATALAALMEAAPSLKPLMAGATWVGNRRWDLRFQSGETLALPEGEKESAAALVKFARMDGMERLLGRGFLRFDMRLPDKFVVRVPPQGTAKKDVPGAAPGTAATAGAAAATGAAPANAVAASDGDAGEVKGDGNGTNTG
ncbi:cell division protein FtsQ/DivIB [Sphingomonas sp. C3-2]|uniref:cell division protein FtsQ/DivIB n=1 Tax=Sphingomonas sp. C3-2 TaxID=3062169 RepID=UPI00294B86C9|nr:cell division protein FtsQ/DivIB [Sphingomonas sp. C3-2]WOK35704.1 cell division protein FtsQ/DivIB [Sphingomonas sp. C3-2]